LHIRPRWASLSSSYGSPRSRKIIKIHSGSRSGGRGCGRIRKVNAAPVITIQPFDMGPFSRCPSYHSKCEEVESSFGHIWSGAVFFFYVVTIATFEILLLRVIKRLVVSEQSAGDASFNPSDPWK